MSTPSNPSPTPSNPTELPKAYRPSEHEHRIRERWMAARAFSADPSRVLSDQSNAFSILIPPPNVTARLHLGHALNNTLQDVLTRAHRMMGYETLWMPGTDHAGIATQAVVERRLWEEEKKRRSDFTREAFVARVQAWKDDYEKQITDQLKLMGCSCDFDRQRFTMDPICAEAVREAFFRLFKDGLIYRGKRLVNWDPALQTAVADDECYEEDIDTSFWYMRYPLVASPAPSGGGGGGSATPEGARPVTWDELARRGYPGAADHPGDQHAWVTVATTRPETYLADTAVALSPHDPRLKALHGFSAQLPLVGRVIPIIADSYVVLPEAMARTEEEKNDPKAKYATGFLKVTPGHDENDYQVYLRHKDTIDNALGGAGSGLLNMMSPDGKVSDKHGWTDVGSAHLFVGLTMAEARKKVVAEFKSHGLLEAIKPYKQAVTFSDRSKARVEPYLSDQWYVRVTDPRMAASANAALVPDQRTTANSAATVRESAASSSDGGGNGDGSMRFHPARYAKTFEQWHDNIRDWCISRQLWWGHRIPVWTLYAGPARDVLKGKGSLHPDKVELTQALSTAESGGRAHVRPNAEILSQKPGETTHLLFTLTDSDMPLNVAVRDPDGEDAPLVAVLEKFGFERDPDVLDTWFSSALWPLSTMGWPRSNDHAETRGLLEAFNPTSTLCTAREIITLWVSRMTMFNRYFTASPGPTGGGGGGLGGGATPEGVPSARTQAAHRAASPSGLADSATSPARSGGGVIPFRDVYIHAVVQDGEGQKMSKSLGNGVDPIDIIETHGSDAMRYTLAQMATQTQDVRLPVDILDPASGEAFTPKMVTNSQGFRVAAPIQEHKGSRMISSYGLASGEAKPAADLPVAKNTSSKFDFGRNFANKLWNASRFTMSILDKGAASNAGATTALSLPDQWLLSRLAHATREIETALNTYDFAAYAQTLYRFIWDDFCDWYLEAIKPTVASSPRQQAVLATALRAALALAHPVMPFITEAIWEQLRPRFANLPSTPEVAFHAAKHDDLLCTGHWPHPAPQATNKDAEAAFDRLRALITSVREVRAQHNVPPKRKINLHAPAASAKEWQAHAILIGALAGVEAIAAEAPTTPAVRFAFDGAEYAASNLADAVDVDTERARLTKLAQDLEKSIATLAGRLANPGYAAKAPPHMVKQTEDQLAKARADLDAAKSTLATLN